MRARNGRMLPSSLYTGTTTEMSMGSSATIAQQATPAHCATPGRERRVFGAARSMRPVVIRSPHRPAIAGPRAHLRVGPAVAVVQPEAGGQRGDLDVGRQHRHLADVATAAEVRVDR